MVFQGSSQLPKTSSKALYQYILTAKQPCERLKDCLNQLLRRTFESPQHFDFLLHRVNWFAHPLTHYHQELLNLLRIFIGQTKHTARVIYNFLIQSFTHPDSQQHALRCLTTLFQQTYDKKLILACLKENYPHKLCQLDYHILYLQSLIQLCQQFPPYRADLVEIIIENLINFDTELVAGDEWVHRPFPEELKIIKLRETAPQNDLAVKFDVLLEKLLSYFLSVSDSVLLEEILLVFQTKILPIKTTKVIQLAVFVIVESSKSTASTFTSFLLSNIFETKPKENSYRIFNQSNFYLCSYLSRSKKLSQQAIAKTVNLMVGRLRGRLQEVELVKLNEGTQLKEVFYRTETLLVILQSIMLIVAAHPEVAYNHQQYEQLIDQCHHKLHFQYFIREEILEKAGIKRKDNKNGICVKFSNKFIPSTLPITGQITDKLMKLPPETPHRAYPSEEMKEPACRKLHKGETPMSYCSQTVI